MPISPKTINFLSIKSADFKTFILEPAKTEDKTFLDIFWGMSPATL